MKKLLTVLMIGLLVLAGCSQSPEEGTSDTLKISGLLGGYGDEGWKKVAAAFEEKYDIKVELKLEKNIADILRPEIQAGDVPDLVYLAVDNGEDPLTNTMIIEKAIMDISDVLDMDVADEGVKVKDKIMPSFLTSNRVQPYGDGKTYLAPLFYSPLGMFYNAGLLEEKGWEVPTTWDEMWVLGDKAKAEGISLFTYPVAGYFDGFLASLLNVTGGPDHFNKLMNYDEEAWKAPETTAALEIIGKLAEYTHPNTVAQANSEGFTKNQQLILDNEALFMPNGTWVTGEMAEAPRAEGFKWGMAPIPAVAGGDRYASTFTEEIYIPNGAKNVDGAKKFLSFLYSDQAAELFFENGGAVQPIIGSEKLIPAGDELEVFYQMYSGDVKANTMGFVTTKTVEGVNIKDVLYPTINEIVNGDKTVEQWQAALAEAAAKFK